VIGFDTDEYFFLWILFIPLFIWSFDFFIILIFTFIFTISLSTPFSFASYTVGP